MKVVTMKRLLASLPLTSYNSKTRATIGSLALLFVLTFGVSTLMTGVARVAQLDRAEACRDCPFPMRLTEGLWLMPNGLTEILIEEHNIGGGRIQSTVRLIDSMTGQILAIGKLDHNKGRKRLKVDLIDAGGGRMNAVLHYQNNTRTQLKVKITCDQCNIQSSYWE